MYGRHNVTYNPIGLEESGLLVDDNAPLSVVLDVSEKEIALTFKDLINHGPFKP
jgi:hypothetical protein